MTTIMDHTAIQYELVDAGLLNLMISLQQVAYQASSSNCTGTRDFIFALDIYMNEISKEIKKQGSPG